MKGVGRKLFIELLCSSAREDDKGEECIIDIQTAGSDRENI